MFLDKKDFINQSKLFCQKEDFEQNVGLLEESDKYIHEYLLECFSVGMPIEQSFNFLALVTMVLLPSFQGSFMELLKKELINYKQPTK